MSRNSRISAIQVSEMTMSPPGEYRNTTASDARSDAQARSDTSCGLSRITLEISRTVANVESPRKMDL